MKATATWGGVQTPEKWLWVRLTDRNALLFETGQNVITGGERAVVAALSVAGMALRKTILPFNRRDQIWALLPQEAMDTHITRFEDPGFALQWEPVEQGANVFFAQCDRRVLNELLARLKSSEIKPVGVVLAELGAWPLLDTASLLTTQNSTLIVDASAEPVAIYTVTHGQLHDLRIVSPATAALGEEALLNEITWLSTDLLKRLPDANPIDIKLIFLGQSDPFWQPFLDAHPNNSIEIPNLESLGQGLRGWEWLRPAGLALAAAQGSHGRLMDFLNGAGEREWQTWLRPWRTGAILALILLLVWGGQEMTRFVQAKTRYATLKAETETIFRSALPTIPVIVEPLLQLKQALGQTSGAKEGLFPNLNTWIKTIQTALPAETQVKWLRLRYEPGEIQLTGEVPSYQHLDKVRAALQQVSGGHETRVDEARIVSETKSVRFRLGLL